METEKQHLEQGHAQAQGQNHKPNQGQVQAQGHDRQLNQGQVTGRQPGQQPGQQKNRGGKKQGRAAGRAKKRTLGLVVALIVFALAVGGAAGAIAFTGVFSAQHGGEAAVKEDGSKKSDSSAKVVDVQDKSAKEQTKAEAKKSEEEQAAADARRAELELDPNKQTEWNTTHNNGTNTVYLTFDDGPSENTKKVLDILDTYGAKATFFVTGNDADYRSSIKDAYDRGNAIGMHTMTHDYSIYSSVDTYFNDLHQVEEVVKEQIGYVPYLVRFPGGSSNTVSRNYCSGIMSQLSQELQARGYQYYDWNVSSSDAAAATVDTETIVQSSCVEGYPNVMLLFHDSASKTTTVEALPRIIEFYRDRGYEFKAIDRSVWVQHHAIAN